MTFINQPEDAGNNNISHVVNFQHAAAYINALTQGKAEATRLEFRFIDSASAGMGNGERAPFKRFGTIYECWREIEHWNMQHRFCVFVVVNVLDYRSLEGGTPSTEDYITACLAGDAARFIRAEARRAHLR